MIKRVFLSFTLLFAIICCMGCEEIVSRAKDSSDVIELNDISKVEDYAEDALKDGQKEITFKTEDIEEDDLSEINNDINSYYGEVEKYIVSTDVLGVKEFTLELSPSVNSYVELYFLKNNEIPKKQKQARLLQEKCQNIMDEILADKDTDYEKELAIHNYLVENCKYGYVEGAESQNSTAYSSYGALVDGKAVCDGYSQAMKLLCDLEGISCDIVIGSAKGENHAWNCVKLDGEWYQVDTTWDDPKPDNPDMLQYTYFNMTSEQTRLEHSWEEENYPEASGTKYNYYVKNDLVCEDHNDFVAKCQSIIDESAPELVQLQVKDYDEATYDDELFQEILHNTDVNELMYTNSGEAPYTTIYLTFSY